jgi:hypothetical protein
MESKTENKKTMPPEHSKIQLVVSLYINLTHNLPNIESFKSSKVNTKEEWNKS